MKRRIALLAGGFSGEYEVSMKSAKTIWDHLDPNVFEPYLVEVKQDAWTVLQGEKKTEVDLRDFSFLSDSVKVKFDYAYIIIHGSPGENGQLQGYLEMKNIPFCTGSLLNVALTFNKATTQGLLKCQGISVAEHLVFTNEDRPAAHEIVSKLGLPCFVKPTESGSSLGVSKVKHVEEMDAAINHALSISDQAMAESFLNGRELACGVMRTAQGVVALPITEIIPQAEFFDYKAKYEDDATQEVTPAHISEEISVRCQELSKQIYTLTGCDGLARVDFFLCGQELFVVEVNTVPGMSAESIVPQQLRSADIDFKAYLTWKIESDLKKVNT